MTVSVGELMERWNLSPDGAPLETPRGSIYRVRLGGRPAILKAASAASDEIRAGATLRHYDGVGAVRLYAEEAGAILLERAEPGTPLTPLVAEGRDDVATGLIAETALLLHRSPPPEGFPPVVTLADGFSRQRERAPHPLLPVQMLARAEAVYRDLAKLSASDRLLHGDLHHGNILLDDERGWLSIDPKGLVGDPAYEAVSALGNPSDLHPFAVDTTVMRRRIAIFAERLRCDPQRIAAWTAAHFVLAACWHVEDGNTDADVGNCLDIASVAERLT